MKEDEIEIIIPSEITGQIDSIKNLSSIAKIQIAKKVSQGLIKIQQKRKEENDFIDRCNMIFEIMADRSKFDKYITMSEIKDIFEKENITGCLIKLHNIARKRNIQIKSMRRYGEKCYQIIS